MYIGKSGGNAWAMCSFSFDFKRMVAEKIGTEYGLPSEHRANDVINYRIYLVALVQSKNLHLTISLTYEPKMQCHVTDRHDPETFLDVSQEIKNIEGTGTGAEMS